MSKIVVAGSINMDVVAQVTHHPIPGQTIFGHGLQYIPGGKGSNQAVAASRLREGVSLIGKLGRDPFGDALTEFLKSERLNLDYLSYSDKHPSGVALITVDEGSENAIIVLSGSNFAVMPEDVSDVPLEVGDIVVSVFEIPQPTIKALFERASSAGAKTILNPAPATAFMDGLLELVDYLILNETELAFFSKLDTVSESLEQIRKQVMAMRPSPQQTVVVTLGAGGVLCISGDQMIQVEGLKVDAVDTTGAGDCFTGAFAVAISEGMPLEDAIQFANVAASLSVQQVGASTSMPDRDTVDHVLEV